MTMNQMRRDPCKPLRQFIEMIDAKCQEIQAAGRQSFVLNCRPVGIVDPPWQGSRRREHRGRIANFRLSTKTQHKGESLDS